MSEPNDKLMDLVVRTMQSTLTAVSELKGEVRGLHRRMDDLSAFNARMIKRSEEEIFPRFLRDEAWIARLEQQIEARAPPPRTSWAQAFLSVFKAVTLGQALAMLGVLIGAMVGIITRAELKLIILKQFGL